VKATNDCDTLGIEPFLLSRHVWNINNATTPTPQLIRVVRYLVATLPIVAHQSIVEVNSLTSSQPVPAEYIQSSEL
jgi:hypothetical protein